MLLLGSGLFLNNFLGISTKCKPIVGWHSIIAAAAPELSGDITSTISPTAIWTPNTHSGWESDPITATPIVGYITLSNDLTTGPVNYFGMIGDNFGQIGATYSLQYYDSDLLDWVDFDGFDPFTPATDGIRFHYFEPIQPTGWRLKIEHPGGENIVFKIAHMKLGAALILQRATYVGIHSPNLNKEVNKLTMRGSSGKYLDTVVRSYNHKYEMKQPNNDPTFVREYIIPFLDHMNCILKTGTPETGYGAQGTCFYAWRWDEFPTEIVYCGSPKTTKWPINQRANKMMDWEIEGDAEI